ncbi:DNA alkylation repair protein [Vibrio natriegens]|uniref:DNA alkylation repair protein n=1 Tax=Vibrio natriegens TaxID=691 RepID=UPI001EFD8B2A|nr:DNA alkylation repair protein [Vibrio natriegens]
MAPTSFVAAIDEILRQYANPQVAFDMRAYLLNQFEFLGIRAPVRRSAVKAIVSNTVWTSPQYVIKIAQRLWEKPEREFRYTAIDFLKRHAKWLDVSHLPALTTSCR